MSKILELFGVSATAKNVNWQKTSHDCWCPYLDRLCLKNRKSAADILIGTCSVHYGKDPSPIIICPHRLLQNNKIFFDSAHLLKQHEPGNEYHVVSEVSIPGGSVDYFLVSVKSGKVKDFVGIELQTLDTTGTVWPERQRFLHEKGIAVPQVDIDCGDSFGMNWKMTAKTILMQLHHKVETFDGLGKRLVLVIQQQLLAYIQRKLNFAHVQGVRDGDPLHFHAYKMDQSGDGWKLELADRVSTDAVGMAKALGLEATAKVELNLILELLESKISDKTLLKFGTKPLTDIAPPTPPS